MSHVDNEIGYVGTEPRWCAVQVILNKVPSFELIRDVVPKRTLYLIVAEVLVSHWLINVKAKALQKLCNARLIRPITFTTASIVEVMQTLGAAWSLALHAPPGR
jgi:uncharacterized membrane protein